MPGRPTILNTVGQGPTALAVGAGGGCLDIFTLIYPFSSLSPSLWETARYRLKYCLKGPLNPKQPTNQVYAKKMKTLIRLRKCAGWSESSMSQKLRGILFHATTNFFAYWTYTVIVFISQLHCFVVIKRSVEFFLLILFFTKHELVKRDTQYNYHWTIRVLSEKKAVLKGKMKYLHELFSLCWVAEKNSYFFHPWNITINHEYPCRIKTVHPRSRNFTQGRGLSSVWLKLN